MGKKHLVTLLLTCLASAWALAGEPAESTRLRVEKSAGGALLLAWDDADARAAGLSDPTIYEGSLETLRKGHWDLEPVDCDTGGDRREEILPTPGSRYYLLVPRQEKRRAEIERGRVKIPRRDKPSPCALQSEP